MLDLANKTGVAYNSTVYVVDGTTITDLSGILSADIDGAAADAKTTGEIRLYVETGATVDIATFPTTLLDANGDDVLSVGTKLRVVKASTDPNALTAVDVFNPAITYGFADRYTEFMELTLEDIAGTLTWGA